MTYIHSKGTFHPSAENDRLRRNLMKGVVGCIQQGALASSDVCGLRASPLPHPHLPGNMWAARCSYVRKLPDPSIFNKKMVLASKSLAAKSGDSCQPWHVGLSRFSAEHWVLSHPSGRLSFPTASRPTAQLTISPIILIRLRCRRSLTNTWSICAPEEWRNVP